MNIKIELWYSGKENQFMAFSIFGDFETLTKLMKSMTVKANESFYFVVRLLNTC